RGDRAHRNDSQLLLAAGLRQSHSVYRSVQCQSNRAANLSIQGANVIHVIATIQVNLGTREAFLKEFLRLTPLVRAETGCLEYGATIDQPTTSAIQELAGEDAVVVVEKWASVDAL